MRQYDLWWASLPSPIGRRPVMLLTRDMGYGFLNKVLIAEITTRIRNIPQEVRLGRRDGLPQACVANFDNLHSIPRAALTERIGGIPRVRIVEVKRALGSVLAWPELTLDD